MSKWYTEATSEWTLDYPPFFAWFERVLSLPAPFFDPQMLVISSKPYLSQGTLIFQRVTVIISDLMYCYAVYKWIEIGPTLKLGLLNEKLLTPLIHSPSKDSWFDQRMVLAMLLLLNPGLLLVDHIHFQYNGFLSGVFLLSILRMMEGRFVQSSLWFTVLLNLKHIYLYAAPAYFIFILRFHCLDRHYNFRLTNFIQVASLVLGVFALSFAPFILTGSLRPLLSRLFPFKRGLTHAYWAPNFWAIYNFLDKVLSTILRRKGMSSSSSGLVQEVQHLVLPSITPTMTIALVVGSMIPALVTCWRKLYFSFNPTVLFLRLVVLASFCSFMFGFHVHEKAILVIIIPMTPLVLVNKSDAINFLVLSLTGTYSLFPLIYESAESVTKVLITLAFLSYAFPAITSLYSDGGQRTVIEQDTQIVNRVKSKLKTYFKLLDLYQMIYLAGFILLHIYCSLIHTHVLGLNQQLPFIPLMFTSVYCSLGVIYSFIQFYMTTINYD